MMSLHKPGRLPVPVKELSLLQQQHPERLRTQRSLQPEVQQNPQDTVLQPPLGDSAAGLPLYMQQWRFAQGLPARARPRGTRP